MGLWRCKLHVRPPQKLAIPRILSAFPLKACPRFQLFTRLPLIRVILTPHP